jgi:SecD/SecF fusion protein
MEKKIVWRLTLVALSILVILVMLLPSIWYYHTPLEKRQDWIDNHPKLFKNIVNLGLDLQGGMRLVLEIDKSKADKELKDPLNVAYTIIENRVNGLGIAEPTIQKQGSDRIIVELPGLKDEAKAKEVIGQTAQLKFMLVLPPDKLERAINVIDNVLSGKAAKDSSAAAVKDTVSEKNQEKQKVAENLIKGGQKDSAIAAKDTVKPAADSGEIAKTASIKDYLVPVMEDQIGVRIGDIPRVKAILARADVREALDRASLNGNAFLWGYDTISHFANGDQCKSLYYLDGAPKMSGTAIKNARSALDQNNGGAKVNLEMNAKGAKDFSRVTATNVDKFLAIVLDSTVYSAPRIIQKISLGSAEITGHFTIEEAQKLAVVLQAGTLPAPAKIIQEQTIGPSLGADSIKKAVMAGWISILFIVFFALIYYRISGFIALGALSINILAVLALMAMLNATLTLPGIAGLILQLAMGIDANVIIFERIREEDRTGKTPRASIEAGYKMAFWTIIDSHFTALITAFILLWKGTGAIRGFAVTLILGILSNIYTALFVTRVPQDIIVGKNRKKLSI